MVPGTIFLGHSYFPSVSNDISEKKWDLKSVMDCPFKTHNSIVYSRVLFAYAKENLGIIYLHYNEIKSVCMSANELIIDPCCIKLSKKNSGNITKKRI